LPPLKGLIKAGGPQASSANPPQNNNNNLSTGPRLSQKPGSTNLLDFNEEMNNNNDIAHNMSSDLEEGDAYETPKIMSEGIQS